MVSKSASTLIEELSKEDKEKIMFYLDKKLHTKLKEFCLEKKIRMSSLVEKLIHNFFDDIKGDNK